MKTRRDNSGLIIFVLLVLLILVAQGRRNCEVPSASYVPCIWGEKLLLAPHRSEVATAINSGSGTVQ
jgi:hypothetical protein